MKDYIDQGHLISLITESYYRCEPKTELCGLQTGTSMALLYLQ